MESRAGDGNHRIVALTEDSGSMQPDRIRALVKTIECEEAVLWVAPPPTPLKGQDCFLLPCLGGRVFPSTPVLDLLPRSELELNTHLERQVW